MKRVYWWISGLVLPAAALFLLHGASAARQQQDLLWHYRNLGKAFYENPTTQKEAVDEFKKALDLAPNSARERVNYGLALLRAGQTKEGVAELAQSAEAGPEDSAHLVQPRHRLQERRRLRARHPAVEADDQAGAG